MAPVDGFIAGIFKYCDRWCETCAFTARCRLFAELARAEGDAEAVKDVAEAPVEQGTDPALSGWMRVLRPRDRMDATIAAPDRPVHRSLPVIASEHRAIYERAGVYADWVRVWLRQQDRAGRSAACGDDPIAVIAWFAPVSSSKIFRALTGLAAFDGNSDRQREHEGAAKAALIGLERSQAAWRQLATDGIVPEALAARPVRELAWIAQRLEEVIPHARRFVRPGFDEPA
jgi:NAD(P)-dependent dehydrogenase (short-subunit alcohol dehydrogenase family)